MCVHYLLMGWWYVQINLQSVIWFQKCWGDSLYILPYLSGHSAGASPMTMGDMLPFVPFDSTYNVTKVICCAVNSNMPSWPLEIITHVLFLLKELYDVGEIILTISTTCTCYFH